MVGIHIKFAAVVPVSGFALRYRSRLPAAIKVLIKQCGELLLRHGWTEQETLYFVTAQFSKYLKLPACLDAFGNDLESHVMCHGDDRTDNGGIISVASDVANKGAVNLDGVDGKALEVV